MSAQALGAAGGAGGAEGLSSVMGSGGGMPSGGGGGGGIDSKALLSLGTSLVQGIGAMKAKNRADSAMPGQIDPRQAAFLSELNQKRKAIDTGADFATGMNAIDSTNAATKNAIVQSTGGDTGGTIQGLLSAQRGADTGKGQVLAAGQNQQLAYTSLFNDLNNKIAARQLQIQMQRSQQSRAEWAQKQQMANQNFMAGVGALASGNESSQQPGEMPGATSPASTSPLTSASPEGQKSFMDGVDADPSFLNNINGVA